MEVSLAQLDSFTRFAENTHKCRTDMSFVAMAAQGVKLMERLNNTHGDKRVLEHRLAIGSSYKTDSSKRVPLDELFTLGQPNTLTFLPQFGFEISNLTLGKNIISIKASLAVRSSTSYSSTNYRSNNPLPLFFPTIPLERCRLNVEASYNRKSAFAEVKVDQSSCRGDCCNNLLSRCRYPPT